MGMVVGSEVLAASKRSLLEILRDLPLKRNTRQDTLLTMAKKIILREESRAAILRSINQLADAVKITLRPKGRNVVIGKRFGSPTITKDGVTVAKRGESSTSITLLNQLSNR